MNITADLSKIHDTKKDVRHIRTKELDRAIHVGTLKKNIVDIRVYRSRSNPAGDRYAIVWILTPNNVYTGIGTTSGYGYDKLSAAVGIALRDMGIELSCRIDGAGVDAVNEAAKAIALALGYAENAIYLDEAYA